MYKRFNIDTLSKYSVRTGTYGYQPKFLTKDSKFFVKEQARISGYLKDDWKCEILACRIAKILGIPCVEQKPCVIVYSENVQRYGVYSDNFELENQFFIPFDYLMQTMNNCFDRNEYIRCHTAVDKMEYLIALMHMATGIKFNALRAYMLGLACLDILCCNTDRHIKNFGVLSTKSGFRVAPVFDNGMSFMESVADLSYYKTFEDCSREFYIEPYSEDPFDLLQEFDSAYNIKKYIRPHISELRKINNFPNKYAREYYKKILEACK